MNKCDECGSYAINHHCHGRDGSDPDLCDVCYWRKRATQPAPAEQVDVVAWQAAENPLFTTADRRVMHEWAGNQYPIVELMTVAQHQRIVAALSTQQSAHHSDDVAVERFAAAMKAKLARCREKGRHGWQTSSAAHLSSLLYHHMYKADPLDVANLAMMLHQNGQAIELPHEARKPVAQQSAHVSVPRDIALALLDDGPRAETWAAQAKLRALLASAEGVKDE